MAAKTCGSSYKSYGPSSVLSPRGSTFSKSISPFSDLDKLSEPPLLSNHPNPALDTLLVALSLAKYTEEDLQHIFKMVLKAQTPTLVFILLHKDL